MIAMVLGNPAGLWAALALPALVAIHFLQQRRRRVAASTLFLLEHAAPVSAGGSRWERLRVSRALLAQLVAVLLALWVLVQPRWMRADATRTVALVLDASASLGAFRAEAIAAAEAVMADRAGLAAQTEWLVLTSDAREPALYRGRDRALAAAALRRWVPARGTHDAGPALRLAAGAVQAAGGSGETVWITDRRARVPAGQAAVGVGRPLENVGFAGGVRIEPADTPGGAQRWRALVRHHGATPQVRTWWVETADGRRSPPQSLTLAPGALVELAGEFPRASRDGSGVNNNAAVGTGGSAGAGARAGEGDTPAASAGDGHELVVVLEADAFPADDRLPVVAPEPRELRVAVELGEGQAAATEFFEKLLAGVPGVVRAVEANGADGAGAARRIDLVIATRPGARGTAVAPVPDGVGGAGVGGAAGVAANAADAAEAETGGRPRENVRANAASGGGTDVAAPAPALPPSPARAPGRVGPRAWIIVPVADDAELAPAGAVWVTAEAHPLTEGLTWSGWFGAAPGAVRPTAEAEVLLWQGTAPLAWIEAEALWLNFSWRGTNAARLPATVLLVRRFLAEVQARGPGRWADNFDAGQALGAAWTEDATATPSPAAPATTAARASGGRLVERAAAGGAEEAREIGAAEWAVLRAPARAGFFTATSADGGRALRGAAQFADGRQADFADAASFTSDLVPAAEILARTTQPDPWVPLWLVLAGGALVVAWWPARARRVPA